MELPLFLENHYTNFKIKIRDRLIEFGNIPESQFFYELCFCICTPQSKAESAWIVQQELQNMDFFNKPFDTSSLLRRPGNYIRFHNSKAERLLSAREKYPELLEILRSSIRAFDKRTWIYENIKGVGMKEASHFLRNIGYLGLSILDRHILRHLVNCSVFPEIPKVSSVNNYLQTENKFLEFSSLIGIPVDELDLLFWSYQTGKILK